jgi:hypothetical protein
MATVLPPLSPTVAAALAAYPPPYSLTGDVACFPTTANAGAVEAVTGARPLALGGRCLVVMLAASYATIRHGRQQSVVTDADGEPYRYRELGWLALGSLGLTPQVRFGPLWVDAPSPLPIDLGGAYGFSKAAGAVGVNTGPDGLTHIAGLASGLRIEARRFAPLPGWLAHLTPSLRGRFAGTGLSARLAVIAAAGAGLLKVQRWDAPELAPLGVRAWGWGLLLTNASIFVGPPE